MLFDDTYLTIEKAGEGIFKDCGSKFIGFALPVRSENEFKPILQTLKLAHPKANHHCWALRLTPDRSVFRINDDGEPSGTAGRPILNTILSRNLTNMAIVVVRYFGGTLLGVPGLINAYKNAAEEALKQVVIIEHTVNDVYTIAFDYIKMNEVMKIIKDDSLAIISQQFNNECLIKVAIRKTMVGKVLDKLALLDDVKLQFDYTF
jgi:uncharacterized YigZ family protein